MKKILIGWTIVIVIVVLIVIFVATNKYSRNYHYQSSVSYSAAEVSNRITAADLNKNDNSFNLYFLVQNKFYIIFMGIFLAILFSIAFFSIQKKKGW